MKNSNLDLGEASSLSDFIQIVSDSKQIFHKDLKIWFRGEPTFFENTFLTPGSFRLQNHENNRVTDGAFLYFQSEGRVIQPLLDEIKQFENNIDAEFYHYGDQYLKINKIKNTRINRYLLMQHYNVKTRLLDWSYNALYALYFAIQDIKNTEDGVVWLMDPWELNDFTTKNILKGNILENGSFKKVPYLMDFKMVSKELFKGNTVRMNEILRRYFLLDFKSPQNYYPFAILPPQLDLRFTNQQSCFTIFGNILNPFTNTETHRFIKKITIKGTNKSQILEDLDFLGINVSTIYPTLDNLGIYLNKKLQIPLSGEVEK